MARRQKTGNRVLAHERLVDVKWGANIMRGVTFGVDPKGGFIVCIARDELLKHEMTGHGPCINRRFAESDVTFVDGEAISITPGEEDEEETEEQVSEE